ncbi:MAG: hypothetical protein KIS91_04410 [Anaerolineae bacterium]|nr:hypothetical protein [Anaerolineae bacterium]
MADISDYQTPSLIVLIGTNPLPNYIAARLLLKAPPMSGEKPTLYMVHTSETEPLCARLQDALSDGRTSPVCIPVPVDGTNAADVHAKIIKYASKHRDIGLNYTGGTKFIAVHAHAAFRQVYSAGIGSYLDARTLTMRFDRGQDYLPPIDVALVCPVPLLTLFKLHGYSLKDSGKDAPCTAPRYPELCQALAQIPTARWREWCDSNLRGGRDTDFRKDRELQAVALPTDGALAPLTICWQDSATLGALANELSTKVGDLAGYLDGDWLEHYTLWALQQVATGCHIHDATQNIVPNERNFQFDVVSMRGYQLFALSCSTDRQKGRLSRNSSRHTYERASWAATRRGSPWCAARRIPRAAATPLRFSAKSPKPGMRRAGCASSARRIYRTCPNDSAIG